MEIIHTLKVGESVWGQQWQTDRTTTQLQAHVKLQPGAAATWALWKSDSSAVHCDTDWSSNTDDSLYGNWGLWECW